jgi:hypothetical protein
VKSRAGVLLLLLVLVSCADRTNGKARQPIYDPARADHAELWQFCGATAETVGGATRVTFAPEGIAYLLWLFPCDWSGWKQLEVNVDAAQKMTLTVAVFDDFDSCALRTETVKAGAARLVFALEDILRDGVQPLFVKKIVLWADAGAQPASLTLGRIDLSGTAETDKVPRNWMTLCDGESPHSESMWEQFRSGGAQAVSEHVTQGRKAIRLQFAGNTYSSAFGLIQPDWRGYKRLVMDVFNPTEGIVKLRIGIRPSWLFYNGVEGVHVAQLKPGANHIVCNLLKMAAEAEGTSGKKFDFSIMQNFTLKLLDNDHTVNLYFDDIHLEGWKAKRPGAVPAFLTRSYEGEWYERFGLKDDTFAVEPLSPEELASGKLPGMTELTVARGGHLLAGVAKINITPTNIRQGRGARLLSNVFARALVLSDGRTKAAIVTLDWLFGWGPATDASRQIAARLTDIPKENIFIWVTHNHSGPEAWRQIGTKGYEKDASEWIASAVVRARQQMRPVRLRGAKANFDLNYNRRIVCENGKAAGFLWEKYLEKHWDRGAVDKEMGLVVLEDGTGRPIASLVMYAGHANMNCLVDRSHNADYPGVVCTTLEPEIGAPILFINGGFGDVDMKGNAVSLERTVKAGLDVARAVSRLRKDLRPLKATPVRCDYVSRPAAPMGQESGRTITVGAVAFGEVAFVQPPGELYNEFSLEIKKGSPYPFTFTAYWQGGYLPTRKAIAEGGYGTESGPDWGELSRDLSIELLKQLHDRN